MPAPARDLDEIAARIRAFRDARDWAQFHNPKDMATAIAIEAAELLEHFLWQPPDALETRVRERRERIEEEIADIGIYLVELADNLGIDLLDAMARKIDRNGEKYPVEKARGSSAKYDEL